VDYTGVTGFSEYMLSFGMDWLKDMIAHQVRDRQAPRSKVTLNEKLNVSKQVYNAANLTPGFDFLAWLIAAKMRQIKHNGTGTLRVAINYERGWKDDPNKGYDLLMVENVMIPLTRMIGGVYVEDITDDFLWPPLGCFQEAVEMCNEGVPVPRLVPHEDAD